MPSNLYHHSIMMIVVFYPLWRPPYCVDRNVHYCSQSKHRDNEHHGLSNRQRLDCLPNRLFRRIEKNTKAPCHWLFTDRWIPRTNGQKSGKCFHLITSTWTDISLDMSNHQIDCDTEQCSIVHITRLIHCVAAIKQTIFKRCRRVQCLLIYFMGQDCLVTEKTLLYTMTSSNGNNFSVTGPLCGEFPNKGQWCGALMLSLICASINGWVNNHEAGGLRRNRAHYDVILMNISHLEQNVSRIIHTPCAWSRFVFGCISPYLAHILQANFADTYYNHLWHQHISF